MRTIPRTTGKGWPGSARQAAEPAGAADPAFRVDWDCLRTANRSCCCPARPVAIVIIPPSPGRAHKTDLLLCSHHLRVSRGVLAVASATVFDKNGRLVPPDAVASLPVG